MCVLDKAESQDITTVTSAACAIVSNKILAQQNRRLNKLGISHKISDVLHTLLRHYLLASIAGSDNFILSL